MEGIFDLGPYQKPYFSAHALFLTLDKICKMPSISRQNQNCVCNNDVTKDLPKAELTQQER